MKYILGVIILLIVVAATLLHFPINIVDALTLETLSDYDIHISVWRILLEPFFGHLLFFNRGVYGIEELQYSLYWLLIIFFFYSLGKIFFQKEKFLKKKFILSQLVNLPLVIGLWFTVFIVIIFLSIYLPSNTIINNTESNILVTTHSHSQFSHDGLISQENLWKWHKRNGFDAFFITDHNTHDKTIDFIDAQRNNKFPIEPLIMAGEEFSGSNHLSLLGLKRKFNSHGYADSVAIDSIHSNGGVVIVNHWFDGERNSLDFYNNLGVDGFEIENSATETSYNRNLYKKIKNFCKSNNLIMVGGLDFHGYGNVCTIWNALKIPGWHRLSPTEKEESILNVIRTRDQSKLKVLMYNDRPFYEPENLFWSPLFSFFHYFRTLNIWQVLSWMFWIFLMAFVKVKIFEREELKRTFTINKILPVLGILGALLMLILALNYYLEIANVASSENDIYEEYSKLLFYIGAIFITYSGITSYFRIIKKRPTEKIS